MSNANVIFTLDGTNMTIQCSTEDKMRDICIKYSSKVKIHINLYVFLYGGNQLNMDLKFKEQANQIDKANNLMKVLVYKINGDGFICPKCGETIRLNPEKIDDIISSNNNIKETLNGIQLMIENVIKSSTSNAINIQLKNINLLINTINEDIKKNIDKIKNLLNDSNILINQNNNNEFQNKNVIAGVLEVKLNEINNNIILFNTDINDGIDVYLNNNKINMIKDNNTWKIDYNFIKDGKYNFHIVFNNIITNMIGFFEKCINIISLDFSNFNTSNVSNMRLMFNQCNKIKEIKGLNKFITNKVTDMNTMFQKCYLILILLMCQICHLCLIIVKK